jgi:transposase
VADGLGVSWNTANDVVLADGRRVVIDDPSRFDGVAVVGVDEHVWRHARREDKYATAIITWLAERPQAWRDRIEVVAMDGLTGFKTAAAEELPDAGAVMDPFHVARLAGDALDLCRRRVQQARDGRRGRKGDPLYNAPRTLHSGADLLTNQQAARLRKLFASDACVEVEATWRICPRMIAAYREPDRARGRELMVQLIESLSQSIPAALTEAINGRLEHLRGSALGFRNLTNYIARSLLEAGGFRPQLHPGL